MKIKNIMIIVAVGALIYFGYKYISSKAETSNATGDVKASSIPDEVQKHLRDFSEGEKMIWGNKEYQVINGAWSIV